MKYFLPSLPLAGLLFLSACSSSTTEVRLDSKPIVGLRDASVQFIVDNTRKLPASGTFDWGFALFRVEHLPNVNLSAADKLIHECLKAGMEKKGFTMTEKDPEFLVSFAVTTGAGLDEKTLNAAYEGAEQPLPIASVGNGQPLQYRRGTLIVDIVQAKTKHLLWRGAITAEIDLTLGEDQKRLRCEGAVGELLKHYPKP